MLKSLRSVFVLAVLFLTFGFVAPNHGVLAQVVTNTSDSGAGSLRAAVTAANVGGGTITFNIPGPGPHTITLTTVGNTAFGNSALAVTNTITIDGASDPDGAIIIDADGDQRHFYVSSSGNLTLQFLTLQNGLAQGGAGANRGGGGMGGAFGGGARRDEHDRRPAVPPGRPIETAGDRVLKRRKVGGAVQPGLSRGDQGSTGCAGRREYWCSRRRIPRRSKTAGMLPPRASQGPCAASMTTGLGAPCWTFTTDC